jgi:hypothetical protein
VALTHVALVDGTFPAFSLRCIPRLLQTHTCPIETPGWLKLLDRDSISPKGEIWGEVLNILT